ncbi:PREDICTED: myosin-3-like [Elephantulus edwardii]|uniref:myosin-3-like n=1 Tax=Elephantulus edwardii TaxID=28737 RepID=UPI0003F06C95|nr:PREDICTED: myosin-3-like [Elephantulus edwardii]
MGPRKRHNPVESICRKIQAIQKREIVSNPIQQIINYQISSFNSPQINTKKEFEEVLKKMAASHISTPYCHSSNSEKMGVFISSPQIESPRTPPTTHLCSLEDITYSIIHKTSENIAGHISQSSQNYRSLMNRRGNLFFNKDLSNFVSKNNLGILTVDLDSTFNEISDYLTPQDSVVKKLFLNEEGWKVETNYGKENVTYSINGTNEEELLTSVFQACDTKHKGSVGVAKIIDYLKQATHGDSEDSALEELWNMLDPKKRDSHVDLETFHTIMKEWVAYCRNKRGKLNSGSKNSLENSVFEQQDGTKSCGEWDYETFDREESDGVLEVSDLISYVADLHFSKQKLEEENNKFRLVSEVLEESNNQLSEDCAELRSQIKSAHQAIMRANLLKEELEELKISMTASEEHKSMTEAQNKHLERENRDLIIEIQILQQENTKNLMDIDRLEKKIEELSKTETEHQIQLHTYEMTLLNKDESLKKRDLHIEELKSTIIEYSTIIENLRGDKTKLDCELQHLQQELLVNGIQLNVSGEYNSIISKEENSLHSELILAQSAEHKEISEIEILVNTSLQWIINSDIMEKKKWENKLNELKRIIGEKLNLCVLMMNSLGNYKESVDKEFAKLIEMVKRFKLEYFHLQKEFLSRQNQLETIKHLQDDVVKQEDIIRKTVQEVKQRLEDAEEQGKNQDQAACSAGKEAKSLQHKIEEAISEQWNLQAINTEIWDTCQALEQKTRRLKNDLHLESLTDITRLGFTLFSCIANRIRSSCEGPKYASIKHGALDVTRGQRCPSPRGGSHPRTDPSACSKMSTDLSMAENGIEHLGSENLPQSREHSTLPLPGHISSTDTTVTSSDSSSEVLNMASGDLDSRSLCKKEQDGLSDSTTIETQGTSPPRDSSPLQSSLSEGKVILNLEAKKEPETMEEHRKVCAAGDTAVSSLPVTTGKSVNFRQSDNISANEKEVEAEFLRLSLGFKCDWFTLEKRVKLEQRSRDLAEENLKTEITNCLKLLESLTPLCEEDNQAQEIIKKLEKSITFLSQCTVRIASRAEMLGAINQESRVSKAVEVMIQHVENLKRMYAKEHAELEELKQVLLQNERSFNSPGDEEDCQIKKRSASLNSKPSSLRRVTIASLPRNIGNAGVVAGMENNDRLSRRSSSWRILGSKQSEHRPSLHRFISTYSWADAEEEKRELKTKEDSEPPEEEIVERTRKPSLSEKRNPPSKWDVSSVYDTVTSWAANLKTSFRNANKALWASVAFIVLFAALMSFLTGLFFQKPVDAAPAQNGDSWTSLEYALWPFTRLQHNGPPPV